jgi:hypothetical protein
MKKKGVKNRIINTDKEGNLITKIGDHLRDLERPVSSFELMDLCSRTSVEIGFSFNLVSNHQKSLFWRTKYLKSLAVPI